MLIPPRYTLTPRIVDLLSEIAANKEVIESVEIPPEIELNIRRNSSLKSSLFSARIEGNPLTLDEITKLPSKDQRKAEVVNILKATNYLLSHEKKDLTISEILKLHELCMRGLSEEIGSFRNNMEAIFNSAGIAIYLPPPPRSIGPLLNRLLKFANSQKERLVPIRAILTHYSFEKIHPFLDGNGRVGRLVLLKILVQAGYKMKGLVSTEEILDEKRSEYYRYLEEPEKDLTEYIEFMLEALKDASERAKALVLEKKSLEASDFLLPRRGEILRIIEEHKLVSFDQIRRRFLKVNQRTLRYDLKKLQDGGLIAKLGETKGVYYKRTK